MKVKYD
jgi:hypothetical protein